MNSAGSIYAYLYVHAHTQTPSPVYVVNIIKDKEVIT